MADSEQEQVLEDLTAMSRVLTDLRDSPQGRRLEHHDPEGFEHLCQLVGRLNSRVEILAGFRFVGEGSMRLHRFVVGDWEAVPEVGPGPPEGAAENPKKNPG